MLILQTTERKLCDSQSQPLDLAGMNRPALHCVDTGSVDIGVPQNIGQAGHILFHAIIRPCKQMPEIMRKDFRGINAGAFA